MESSQIWRGGGRVGDGRRLELLETRTRVIMYIPCEGSTPLGSLGQDPVDDGEVPVPCRLDELLVLPHLSP